MNKKVPERTESVEDLKSLLNATKDTTQKDKIRPLYLLKSGEAKTRVDVARLLGMNRKSIGQWLSKYEAGGLEQLIERRFAPGRQPYMIPSQLEALRAKVNDPKVLAVIWRSTDMLPRLLELISAIKRFMRWCTTDGVRNSKCPVKVI